MRLNLAMKRHIFCLEGEWVKNPGYKTSVSKALEFFEEIYNIKTHIRDCSTLVELESRMKEYSRKTFHEYEICYFAFHGFKGKIQLKNKSLVSVPDLAKIIGPTLQNKIIHFGCCKTLADTKNALEFKNGTQALAVCGYTLEVDFIESTLFDILLFQVMQKYKTPEAIKNKMDKYYEGMVKKLGFVMFY